MDSKGVLKVGQLSQDRQAAENDLLVKELAIAKKEREDIMPTSSMNTIQST